MSRPLNEDEQFVLGILQQYGGQSQKAILQLANQSNKNYKQSHLSKICTHLQQKGMISIHKSGEGHMKIYIAKNGSYEPQPAYTSYPFVSQSDFDSPQFLSTNSWPNDSGYTPRLRPGALDFGISQPVNQADQTVLQYEYANEMNNRTYNELLQKGAYSHRYAEDQTDGNMRLANYFAMKSISMLQAQRSAKLEVYDYSRNY